LLENLDRESLNGIEESRAFRMLQNLGHDPASLAALTRLTEADVSTRIALLDLPEFWQECIRTGKISAIAAEYLLHWTGYPQVLEGLQQYADRWPMPLTQWNYYITETVFSLSRAMSGPDGPQFEVRPEDDEALEVVTVHKSPTISARRAMNTTLWDTRQNQANAVKPQRGRNGKPKQGSETNRNGNPKAESGKRKAEETPNFLEDTTGEFDFSERLADFKAQWLTQRIISRLHELEISHLEALADELGISITAEWQLTREFLDLHSGRHLYELAIELDIDPSYARSKAELVAVLSHAQPKQVPDAFRSAGRKPVAAEA